MKPPYFMKEVGIEKIDKEITFKMEIDTIPLKVEILKTLIELNYDDISAIRERLNGCLDNAIFEFSKLENVLYIQH